MRVERKGRFIHIAIKNGNQERWFNIEEHEAQELALRLGEVLSEPKFVVGDRVRVARESIASEKPADRETDVWLRSISSYAYKQAKELKVEAQDAKYHVDVASKAEGAKEVWVWLKETIDTRLRRMLN